MTFTVEQIEAEADGLETIGCTTGALMLRECAAMKRREAESVPCGVEQVGELLAVIHGDGGHYQAEHGQQKAAKDALVKVIALMTSPPSQPSIGVPELTELVRTAPEFIYLQISDDVNHHEETFPHAYGDEITWCADSVLDCEVKYIRADLAAAPRSP